MSEQKIITLDSIHGNFYGGFPFITNWNFNDGSTPSTLTVSVVNSQGQYTISENNLTFASAQPVTVGSFTFNGYLVGYEIDESAQQKILTLEYMDKSVNLEKWSIGLNDRHGQGGTAPKNMILLGRTYSPCDTNLGMSASAATSGGKANPCDPCPNMPRAGYTNACEDAHLSLKILPVYYTFEELFSKINQCGITPVSITLTEAQKNYRVQHTGTLKNVLDTICGELALSYYYDPMTDTLHFVDRSQPLTIPTLTGIDKTISYKHGATISKNFSRGFIGYVGMDGGIMNYECKREEYGNLEPFTIMDLYGNSTYAAQVSTYDLATGTGGSYDDTNYKIVPEDPSSTTGHRSITDASSLVYCTLLAYYPLEVRRAFIWFYILGIYNADAAVNWKTPYKLPDGTVQNQNDDGTTPSGNTIYELGNMNIIQVITKKNDPLRWSTLTGVGGGGQSYSNSVVVPKPYMDTVLAYDIANNYTDDSSLYFIIAQCNTDLVAKQEERDSKRAKDFVGKYYYRAYEKMAVGGGTNSHAELNIDAAGASCTYHPRGEYIQQLPIFSFGHKPTSKIGLIVNNLAADESDNTKNIGTPGGGDQKNKYRSARGFLLLDRGDAAKFDPHESNFSDWSDVFNWYSDITPQLVGSDGRPKILEQLSSLAAGDTNLKLFTARQLKRGSSEFGVTVETSVDNPWEAANRKVRQQSYEYEDTTQNVRDFPPDGATSAAYGLTSRQSIRINMPSFKIIPPPGSAPITSATIPSFQVIIKGDSKYEKILPKVQKVFYKDAPGDFNKVAQIDYLYKEIPTENFEAVSNQQQCRPSDTEMKTYMDKFGGSIAVSNINPKHKANLKLLGVMPTLYNASQGLCSVQITVGDNGIYTDYTFEDKVILPPSEDLVANDIIRQNRVNPPPGSYFNKTTTAQFNDVKDAVARHTNITPTLLS
jgi:hypothetical protein